MPVFQINTNFALAVRNGAQEADAQVPYQAIRLQNARRAVREARPVRARQDGERGGGDDEKKRKRTIVAEFQMIPTRISPNFRLGHSNSTLDKVSKIAAHCLYLNCLSNL